MDAIVGPGVEMNASRMMEMGGQQYMVVTANVSAPSGSRNVPYMVSRNGGPKLRLVKVDPGTNLRSMLQKEIADASG